MKFESRLYETGPPATHLFPVEEKIMMRLKDKISIVTGAAQGIGRGIADRFVKEGAFVAVIDYKEPKTTLLDGQQLYQGDVSDAEVWLRITSWPLEKHGRIDILVNNAAIVQYAPVHEVRLDDWNRALAVNDFGHAGDARRHSRNADPWRGLDHQSLLHLGQCGRSWRCKLSRHQGGSNPSHEERGGHLR